MSEISRAPKPRTGKIVIEDIRPRTPNGFAAKAVVGRALRVSADVFREGHDVLAARVRWRSAAGGSKGKWQAARMLALGNDRYETTIEPQALGAHELVVEGWTDRLATWRHDVTVKIAAGQAVDVELEEGARHLDAVAERVDKADRPRLRAAADALRDEEIGLEARLALAFDPGLVELVTDVPEPSDCTASKALPLWVDRERAAFSAWYELFPRSYGAGGKDGLRGAASELERVAAMGFDVVYLPPVHPIGVAFRKGKNNTLTPGPLDPGSPWAISDHLALHADLGTFDDFDDFVGKSRSLGMEVALDYALQCAPEHPWLTEHPEWFHHRPDGTIKYAENPPKKYQDIYPLNMSPERDADRVALWHACKGILDFWIGHGVRIFRVDNPHTKPFAFWEWAIAEVQKDHPDILFLAEAFTRPRLMARLAEVGFSQSYTYFTWRNTKAELTAYLDELAYGPTADYMRPNFWPNTPDILSGALRNGGPGAFKLRLVLAATMSPSYGIYSGYEIFENQPFSELNEEYLDSEKYEIKRRDFNAAGNLGAFITTVNSIRRRHPALAELSNISFHPTGNDNILCFSKATAHREDVILVVVNLDPHWTQSDVLNLDLGALGLPTDTPYEALDELTGASYVWEGPNPYVLLTPEQPAHILHLRWMAAWERT